MQFTPCGNGYLIVLVKGQELISSLHQFCREQQISAAWLAGVGAVLTAELGYYHLDKRQYEFQTLDKVLEIVSLSGNVALKAGQAFVHAHAVLSDAQLRTYGGHLKEAIVGGTCEITLTPFDISISRQIDDETGLSLLQL